MQRGAWRSKLLRARGWVPEDAATLLLVNEELNEALKELHGDCPSAFVPSEEKVVLLPDMTNTSSARTCGATTDYYVLGLGFVDLLTALENPAVDGTWDGVMHIEVQDPDGTWHRRQCRQFFTDTVPTTVLEGYYVTIDRPWRNLTDSGMAFRIYQPEVFLRDDVTRVLSGKFWTENLGLDGGRSEVQHLPETFMDYYNQEDFRGTTNGHPTYLVRGRHFQLDAPLTAPVITYDGDQGVNPWLGLYPIGTYKFYFTYVWGEKDPELVAPGGTNDPLWESAPSPVSNTVTMTDGTRRLLIGNLPNIDFMLGFDPASGLRKGHSGLKKRIYVVTSAVNVAGAFIDNVEALGVAMFLKEVSGSATSTFWDGSIVPDYFRRLPESQGYYAHKVLPHQVERMELDFRVYRRPRALGHDGDAPTIQPSAQEALDLLALARLAELDKQPEDADRYRERYRPSNGTKGALGRLLAQDANPATVIPSAPWQGVVQGATGYLPSFRYRRTIL